MIITKVYREIHEKEHTYAILEWNSYKYANTQTL